MATDPIGDLLPPFLAWYGVGEAAAEVDSDTDSTSSKEGRKSIGILN